MRSKKREHYLNLDWLCANYPLAARLRDIRKVLDYMTPPEIDMQIVAYERFIRDLNNRNNVMSTKLATSFDHHFRNVISECRLVRIQKLSSCHLENVV